MRGETITVTRAGEPTGDEDEQGSPVIGDPSTFTISHVALAPSAAGETTLEYGDRVVTGYQCYGPSGTVLRPTDVIEIRGVPGYQVEGEVGQWTSPFSGRGKGVEFAVRRHT